MKAEMYGWRCLVASLVWLVLVPLARGEDPPSKESAQNAAKATAQAPAELAIVGADIYTVSHEMIRGGTILIRDGKIAEVGSNITLPKGCRQIDARGKYVTPGFVAVSMSGVGARPSNDSQAGLGDSLDPFDRNIKICLAVGITTGCLPVSGAAGGFRRRANDEWFPGLEQPIQELLPPEIAELIFEPVEVCPCCGLPILPTEPRVPREGGRGQPTRYSVIRMSYGKLEPMLVKDSAFYAVPRSQLDSPVERFNWRRSIEAARKYLKDQAAHEEAVQAGERSAPPRKTVSDEILALVKKEVALRVDAQTVDQIRDMIALAKELDYRLVLENATEGWLLADELSQAQTPVIITPRTRIDPRPGHKDTSGSSIELSGCLERAGVPFALSTLGSSVSMMGLAGRDLTSLPLEAAFAVRGGCTEKAALEALTLEPARMLGLADQIGSIDPGKDADLLILDGPPLDYRTYVEQALVQGDVCYDRKADQILPVFER